MFQLPLAIVLPTLESEYWLGRGKRSERFHSVVCVWFMLMFLVCLKRMACSSFSWVEKFFHISFSSDLLLLWFQSSVSLRMFLCALSFGLWERCLWICLFLLIFIYVLCTLSSVVMWIVRCCVKLFLFKIKMVFNPSFVCLEIMGFCSLLIQIGYWGIKLIKSSVLAQTAQKPVVSILVFIFSFCNIFD